MDSVFTPPAMPTVLPEGEYGDARISHITITEETARFESLRSMMSRDPWFMRIEAGTYTRLHADGDLQMSDTPMERRTNADFLRRAHGDVLIGGLGIGMLPITLLRTDRPERVEVRSITVVEKSSDVIALVSPHLSDDPRLTIVHADVLTWKPPIGKTYDTLYFDIWPSISEENLGDMAKLHRRYARAVNRENPRATMTSWLCDYLRAKRRSGRRRHY